MARGNHWWSEPPLWAWIVMVVSAVALAVLLPAALDRQVPSGGAAGTTTGAGPAPEASPSGTTADAGAPGAGPTTAPAAEDVRVVVVGDGYTSGTAQGGRGPAGWPALLDERIEGAGVDVAADMGAGYVARGESGRTFGELAEAAGLADADVVVVSGSRDDGPGVADAVAVAARNLFARIGEVAPEAEVVVVGPVWPEAVAPAGARNNRDVIREAAEAVGARFVDPLEEAWFVDAPQLVGEDGVYPTDEGHAYLADRLEPAIRESLTG